MYTTPTELSNGLKYQGLKAATNDNNIYCSLVVRSGSLCDVVHGSAHFLEHMLLNFVKIYGYNRSKALPVAGRTSFDRTSFYFCCNMETFDSTIDLVKTIILGVYLDEEYFDGVKYDILAEYRNCNRIVQREKAFLSIASQNISHFIPIGTTSSIMSLKFNDIAAFFSKEYLVKNMLLITCGDIDAERVNTCITSPLGDITKSEIKRRNEEPSFETIKNTDYSEVLFPISYPPFVDCNELYDYISISLITYILRTFSSHETIHVGIKEYCKFSRFVNIRTSGDISLSNLLVFIKQNLLHIMKGSIDIQWIKNDVIHKLALQANKAQLISRAEDLFVFEANYYDLSEIIKQASSLNSDCVHFVANNMLVARPFLVEKRNNAVRAIDEWSILK